MNISSSPVRKSSRAVAPREILTYTSKLTQGGIRVKQGKDAKVSPKRKVPNAPQKPILTAQEKQTLREEGEEEEHISPEQQPEMESTPTEVLAREVSVSQDTVPMEEEEEEEKQVSVTTTTTSSFSPYAEKLSATGGFTTPKTTEVITQMQNVSMGGEEEEEEVEVVAENDKFGFLKKEYYNQATSPGRAHIRPDGVRISAKGEIVDQYGFLPMQEYHTWNGVQPHQKPDGTRWNQAGTRVNRWFQEVDDQGKVVPEDE